MQLSFARVFLGRITAGTIEEQASEGQDDYTSDTTENTEDAHWEFPFLKT